MIGDADGSKRNAMPDVLVRDLDAEVLNRLKAAAKANRRSLQAEIQAALRSGAARHLAESRRIPGQWLKRLGRSGSK
jgi:hypothetical protein